MAEVQMKRALPWSAVKRLPVMASIQAVGAELDRADDGVGHEEHEEQQRSDRETRDQATTIKSAPAR
jgi:hypothetical protein